MVKIWVERLRVKEMKLQVTTATVYSPHAVYSKKNSVVDTVVNGIVINNSTQ